MESQPQNPEFRNNHENFHPCKSMVRCALFNNPAKKVTLERSNNLFVKH